MLQLVPPSLGWRQDVPDFRDFSKFTPQVQALWSRVRPRAPGKARPERVDLREFFPAVDDQQRLNASTAHACAALVEYFQRRVEGRTVRPSRLFLYKLGRKLERQTGDSGISLRAGLKALVNFGVPPEHYWPYDPEAFDREPEPYLFSFGEEYRGTHYVRLDHRHESGKESLEIVKSHLAAGFPVAFGFPMPTSVSNDADILYRPASDSIYGGQAVVAVGYDDRRLSYSRGALLFRNSWGRSWGEDGHGWLPYRFVEERLAVDFWTLVNPNWLDSGEFERPA